MIAAGFESDIQGCARQRVPIVAIDRVGQCVSLGVRACEFLVVSLAEEPLAIVRDENRSDHGVGLDVPPPPGRQGQRPVHVVLMCAIFSPDGVHNTSIAPSFTREHDKGIGGGRFRFWAGESPRKEAEKIAQESACPREKKRRPLSRNNNIFSPLTSRGGFGKRPGNSTYPPHTGENTRSRFLTHDDLGQTDAGHHVEGRISAALL